MEVLIPLVLVIVGLIIKKVNDRSAARNSTNPNPKIQRLVERMQAQQRGNQPTQFQGQFTQPTSGPPVPGQTFPGQVGAGQQGSVPGQPLGRAQSSAQLAGMLQQRMQAGQNAAGSAQQGQYGVPGQQVPGQYAGPATQYTPPGQFQPPELPQPQFQPPQFHPGQFQMPQASTWSPSYQAQQPDRGTAHRPQQSKAPGVDIDNRVRELMSKGSEVAAVRLLCDEQDMGIIEAQSYARALVAGPGKAPRGTSQAPRGTGQAPSSADENASERRESAPPADPEEAETRYVGSAAFAESVFNTDPDENVWASGWVDKPDQDDRTDIDELWQTVQNNGRPTPPPAEPR
jgi:hypothetical protein